MLLFLVSREVQSFGRPVVRHFVSVACGREVSEPPCDFATQTRREFVVESPPRGSDDERREADEMILEIAEDVARPSGSAAVVDEARTSVIDSSVHLVSVVGSRPVRAGKLNSFIDHGIHRFPSYM